jgi:lipooligosaccharide transport system permease protein
MNRTPTTPLVTAGLLRILPSTLWPTELLRVRQPQRMVERSLMVYRRSWLVLVSGFVEPLFYLMSVQIGFAALIGDIEFEGRVLGYAQFVAPALMAAAAMNGAIFDSTANVFYKLTHAKLYDSVLATPMEVADVALGEISWAMLRGALYSAAFVVVMWALGLTESVWIVMAVPICVLIGFAFAALGMAVTTFLRNWSDFDYIPAVQVPLLLFSATFFPVAQYGQWAWAVQISPLYHGVVLVRMAAFDQWAWSAVGHIAVLVGIALIGLWITSHRLRTLLLK